VSSDIYSLNRFISAQDKVYDYVLLELKNGKKLRHWMWYIFPQIDGLGKSFKAKMYSIKSLEEAKAYLKHPILGNRLKECSKIIYELEGKSAKDIFGYIDSMKLKSSMTLFKYVSEDNSIFEKVLNKYFSNEECNKTKQILDKTS